MHTWLFPEPTSHCEPHIRCALHIIQFMFEWLFHSCAIVHAILVSLPHTTQCKGRSGDVMPGMSPQVAIIVFSHLHIRWAKLPKPILHVWVCVPPRTGCKIPPAPFGSFAPRSQGVDALLFAFHGRRPRIVFRKRAPGKRAHRALKVSWQPDGVEG